jgi:hypothetical protein
MKPLNILQRATDFGTLRSRENFFSFSLKCLLYIVPAILLGNFTDVTIGRIKKYRDGRTILLQTFIILATLYLILIFLPLTSYTSEFQATLAGGLFIVFYFGIQTNYIRMIKQYLQ